ncbi:MAG: phosphoribosylamine--glycine ligase [Salinivirgaceae bacterium]|nr:phosphoribosylamine--glycine ligase [Salinivirgaceae bacterium]MDD4747350.1 phosphoribosylamine--glycine ligase [Salinivirgaceae bacterium]MDY0281914.1 phosphoribosylamine--glycine ligase [Salinivirgaceae bacterium]
MKILLLGSGGREHAIAVKLKNSKYTKELYIAPGNAGTANEGTNIALNPTDFEEIRTFVLKQGVNMVVVGPEEPLVKGIANFFLSLPELANIPVIGPSAEGAKLEGSKQFAKEFMIKYKIPTAQYLTVTAKNVGEGIDFLNNIKKPYVLKADGLAAGKGVIITSDLEEAIDTLQKMLDGMFGKAGNSVVIEEFLDGIEVSYFVLTDGNEYVLLPEAKDYKRIGDGDTGPNTGGMGAVSPVPFCNKEFSDKVIKQVIEPTIRGLKTEHINYKGFVFIGLMNVNGEPFVIEYNCRLGDPETEVIIPRIENDLVELFNAVHQQSLRQQIIKTNEKTAVTVVVASKGYPNDYSKGETIDNLDSITDSIVYHAGTKKENLKTVSNGGRVLAITSIGIDIEEARNKSYKSIDKIGWESKTYRKDIGNDLK